MSKRNGDTENFSEQFYIVLHHETIALLEEVG
jgi:hypothetical protein